MQGTRHKSYRARHQQAGAALFMALIFLLILTMLGVFGMNVSRLENMMAGNAQFQTTALSNAEYVLVQGENDILDIAATRTGNPFLTANDDQYHDAGIIETTDLIWGFTNVEVSIPAINGSGLYVIEDAGLDNSKGECTTYECKIEPLPSAIVQVFLVTAQSSSSRGAKRIVQSVVVTEPLPPSTGSFGGTP